MKKLMFPLVVVFLMSFLPNTGLTEAERAKAVDHLNKTKDHMMEVLDGLTEDQLDFKPSADSWSIAECVEHLAISENTFGSIVQATVAAPANPAMRDSVKLNDDQLYGLIVNRDQKVKTSEAFEPSGKFGSFKETLTAFLDKRKEHVEYVKTTTHDLRSHFNSNLPFGTVDAYQLLIFAAGHTERHVLQMEEIMEHEDFPESED
ncbi:MAG: DinB family protein [Croceitalea sp.]|nr:DinB family protein [Croceitalea sp.]MBT8238812.1 DinB family protein [Croceitalea sp.]NNC34230.1 DinB family protein [Croceitalea sp.]NNL10068.1 DinB family protein [Croceitalea sp.]NNM19365.1 DinB family protein [Croceitalea sp.]